MTERSYVVETIQDIAPVRHALADLLRTEAVAEHTVDGVSVAATELLSNAVLHAETPASLRLELSDRAVLVVISDEDPNLPQVQAVHPERIGGQGLRIVDALADEWGARPGPGHGKEIWFRFDR